MNNIYEIFNSMYGDEDESYLVFDMNGNMIWKNYEAEKLLNSGALQSAEIFDMIKSAETDKGSLNCKFGGKFKRITIFDTDFFVAEIFGNKNILNLMKDKRISQAVQRMGYNFRVLVNEIVNIQNDVYVDLIQNDEINKVTLEKIAERFSESTACCCGIMRPAAMISILMNLGEEGSEYDLGCKKAKDFVTEFSGGCMAALGSKCKVNVNNVCEGYLYINTELLKYFMLIYLFKMIPEYYEDMNFNISAENKDGGLEIILSIECGMQDYTNEPIGLLWEDLLVLTAEKLGITYTATYKKLNIFVPNVNDEIVPDLESGIVDYEGGMFTDYNIILNSIENHKRYY